MKAYHGSHQSKLTKLIYTEENSRFGGDANLVHGAGIYLTTSKTEARAYATSSLYTLNIKGEIFDATDDNVLTNFILNFFKFWDIDEHLITNDTLQSLIKRTSCGDISGVAFAKNLSHIICNDAFLYSEILQCKFSDDMDTLMDSIESFFNYTFIKIRHKGNGTDWVICIDYDGNGIEIVSEEIIS